MDKNYVLVTGGAGYIGSHTCKALAEAGYIPVSFDNLSTGYKELVKWGPLIEGDLVNFRDIERAFETHKFIGVIHLAAKAHVRESIIKPLEYYEGNIQTTTNLLKAMKKVNAQNLVFSSSCATYGEPQVDTISENTPQNPINPYGFSKLACEKLIQYSANSYPLNYAILRYFNAAGADVNVEIREMHNPETHLIPLAIKAAINNSVLSIFGNDYPTSDGTAVRDYVHVTDLADAHVSALNKVYNEATSLICNLGTGEGFSVLEIVKTLQIAFPELEYSIDSSRQGDPAKLVADASLVKSILNWKPQHSSIKNILDTAISWEKSINGK
jgi:UDP-glucose-4-epimerase GalE